MNCWVWGGWRCFPDGRDASGLATQITNCVKGRACFELAFPVGPGSLIALREGCYLRRGRPAGPELQASFPNCDKPKKYFFTKLAFFPKAIMHG